MGDAADWSARRETGTHSTAPFNQRRYCVRYGGAGGRPRFSNDVEAIAEFRQTLQPVDERTPQFLCALAATHDMLGERDMTVEYARRAQKLVVEMGQPQLAEKIETDLKVAAVALE